MINLDKKVDDFMRINFDDSQVKRIQLKIDSFQCQIDFDRCILIQSKTDEISDILSPCSIVFVNVQEFLFSEHPYQMNCTVVEDCADRVTKDGNEFIKFTFTLAGGDDSESYLFEFSVVASDFYIS